MFTSMATSNQRTPKLNTSTVLTLLKFAGGQSVASIAQERVLTEGCIISHICQGISAGLPITQPLPLTSATFIRVARILLAHTHPLLPLEPLRNFIIEKTEERLSFQLLEMVVTILLKGYNVTTGSTIDPAMAAAFLETPNDFPMPQGIIFGDTDYILDGTNTSKEENKKKKPNGKA